MSSSDYPLLRITDFLPSYDVYLSLQRRNRIKLVELLGGKCARCGLSDEDVLEIDHIHGGGRKEMKILGGYPRFLLYYVSQPDLARQRLQILCANHHRKKSWENNEWPYHPPSVKYERQDYRCPHCGQTDMTLKDLQTHLKTHDVPPYQLPTIKLIKKTTSAVANSL